jgi:hypothetical protein
MIGKSVYFENWVYWPEYVPFVVVVVVVVILPGNGARTRAFHCVISFQCSFIKFFLRLDIKYEKTCAPRAPHL